MKYKLIDFCKEFLVTQMNHWTIFSIYMVIMGFLKQEDPFLTGWVLMAAIPLYHYFLRKKVSNVILFWGLHAIMPVICFFTPFENTVVKLVYCLMLIIYAVWSGGVKIKGDTEAEEPFHPIFCIAAIGGASLLQGYIGYPEWTKLYLPIAFWHLGCYFIYLFLEQYQNFLSVNKYSASNIPENEIFTSGFLQTVMFTAVGLGILFLSTNIEWFAYVFKSVGYGMLWITRTLLVWLGGDMAEELPEAGENLTTTNNGLGMLSDGQTFMFWKVLEYIASAITSIVIVLGVLICLSKFFMYLWKNFIYKQYKETILQGSVDVRESCIIEKNERSGLKVFARNNRERVRRIFKKQVLKSKEHIIGAIDIERLRYMTARECCDKIEADTLKRVYEKARYSVEEITAEDMKGLRQSAK